MTSVNIQIFEEFIKFHIPTFVNNLGFMEFCCEFGCQVCKAKNICVINAMNVIPGLTAEEFTEMKEKYPEVFI